ncbi:IS66 family transposase [Sporomusa sp.]|uniref:IS66 family transposase n=1 Tax=Sporomusa sp. TaxID=2078658 RepID=UPI002C9D8871|nr:IS66 family transposase [Sporomusa sp.]HWR06659.1 IS66 family transposase [Sporomusa sp.]HWR43402.1 IS66 family transposase [Sporomusa sp.]
MQTQAQMENEIAALKARIQELEALNKWYIEQLKLSRQKLFGKSSERSHYEGVDQLSLFNEAEADRQPLIQEPDPETISVSRKKGKRGESTKHLPVEVIEYKITEEESACPQCGEMLHVMSKEVRKELTIIPATVKVIEHVSCVYSCRNCEKHDIQTPVITATAPKALLPKSMVSAELLAYIMSQKFVNAMPLYRQEQEFKRLGVALSRQNLSNWVIKGATLLAPILETFKRELLTREVLHADETTLEVLCEPGRPTQTNSYMWVYRTSGDSSKPIVLYDYQEGRSGRFAKQYLSGFTGYLHTDGWNGYHQLEEQGVTLCGCWAHARRKFNEAQLGAASNKAGLPEDIGLSYCNQLFAIEKRAETMTAEKRHTVRQSESKPLIEAFFAWVDTCSRTTLPQSLLGKAFTYAQNQKKYLLAFLDDGRIELSNNRAERSIKPFVIGRKNWLFCNTPGGAKSSADIYSLIQTAIENGLKPQAYLEYVFKQIQQHDYECVDKLLPWAAEIPLHCKMPQTKS